MRRYTVLLLQLRAKSAYQPKLTRPLRRLSVQVVIIILALVTLACGFLGAGSRSASGRVVILTRLPTLTPTRLPTLTPTTLSPAVAVATESTGAVPTLPPPPVNTAAAPDPAGTPPAVAAEVPTPASTPSVPAVPTPVSETPGWTFANVQVYPDHDEDGLLLYGEVINNTGVTQELDYITGTFYDAQGQIIADEDSTNDFWPFDLVPPSERMPFGLLVDGIYSAANFDLQVQAEPMSEALRLDFQFLDLYQWVDEIDEYCVAGELRNPGGELQEYVLMMAILYDGQEKVVNFADELEARPDIIGDDTLEFEFCVETLGQTVARHELRAWGK